PFVMLLFDYWPLDRCRKGMPKSGNNARQWGIKSWLFLEKIPFFALAAASSAVTYLVQREGGAVSSLDMIPLKLRVSNALVSYIAYMFKMIWPQRLAVFYPYPADIPMWKVVGASMLLATISLGAIVSMKRRPYLLVGWLWYIGTLVPMIGLVQVGAQALADRYTYVSLIGLFIMIAWGMPEFWGKLKFPKIGLYLIAAISVLILLHGSWFQNRYWRNSIELFSHTLNMTSNNFVAHNGIGSALALRGRTTEAITQFSEALRIKPHYAKAHNNLGSVLEKQGRIKEAIEHYLEALRICPEYAKAYHNLGNALVKQGRTQEAIKHYLEALRIEPDLLKTHINIGNALDRQGRTEEAIGHYLEALRIRPDSAKAHNNLGNALVKLGRIEEAIKHYLEALRITPGLVAAHKNLGVALFRNGNIEGAIDHFQKALRIRPGDTGIKNNLNQLLMLRQQRK
ncbi:MAG: tetratricopeptide repeat protein, partial [Candidatus Margulisiibacteriota bacterium]